MKNIAFLFVFLMYASFASASNGGDLKTNSKSANLPTCTIEGKIVDKVTHEALAGVTIKLNNKEYYTDFDGAFSIETSIPGTYNLEIKYVSYKGITLEKFESSNSSINLKVELESISN